MTRVLFSRRTLAAAALAVALTSAAPLAAQYGFTVSNTTFAPPIAANLARPIAIEHAGDGSGRLFIVLQGGSIVIWKPATGLVSTPFFTRSVLCCGEQGLLGLAFHPNYETNGFFYVHYTDGAGDTVISRYSVSTANPDLADMTTELPLLSVEQPDTNHNGGKIAFGPDGYLYIGLGDGGSAGDPWGTIGNGQNQQVLLGKILRIDVDTGSPYGIPADNPFFGSATVRQEIWAWGLRNPWKFSFDRATGDLIIADVGQGSWEEINVEPASSPGGVNYGWRRMEGAHCFNPGSGCQTGSLTLPVLEYDHSLGCSVTGGHRARRAGYKADGNYFYADYCTGRLWAATSRCGGVWRAEIKDDTPWNVPSFGEDEAGDLYIVRAGVTTGAVYRLEAVPTTLIFQSGFSLADLTDWHECSGVAP